VIVVAFRRPAGSRDALGRVDLLKLEGVPSL
jgi:hypothetical protein